MQHPGSYLLAYLVVFVGFCSCATTGTKDVLPLQYEDTRFSHLQPPPPPDEYFCRRDSDCTIVNLDFHECCPEQRFAPYAVSRTALDHQQSECEPGCAVALDIHPDEPAERAAHGLAAAAGGALDISPEDSVDPRDFVAVCLRYTCERQQKR